MEVRARARGSRLYHTGAVAERVRAGIAEVRDDRALGTGAPCIVLARLLGPRCVLSVDTSGALLHQRGYRLEGAAAPLRETLAAAFLRMAGYSGDESFVDPFCGSGTLAIEAALMATRRAPGLNRTFAAEAWPSLQADAAALRAKAAARARPIPSGLHLCASDRDAGAVGATRRNAARAGLEGMLQAARRAISALEPPPGPPGLVLCNPPWGFRLATRGDLRDLYAALGAVCAARFKGWRVGVVTADPRLASATGLELSHRSPALESCGRRIRLYCTHPLDPGSQCS